MSTHMLVLLTTGVLYWLAVDRAPGLAHAIGCAAVLAVLNSFVNAWRKRKTC